MWNRDREIAKSSVTTIVSNLNRIYTGTVFQEIRLQFQAAKITIGPDVCSGPITSIHSKQCLIKFSQRTNSTEYCLHYLFTYSLSKFDFSRDFSGGHVGLAWPGVVCKDSAFTQSYNTGWNQTLTMVSENLAHEVNK